MMHFEGLLLYTIIFFKFLSVSSSDDVIRNASDDSRNTFLHVSGFESTEETSILHRESTLCSQLFTGSSNLTIYISEAGTNTPDCIRKSEASPCRTVEYAYNEAMMQITNVTEYITFVFMNDRYNLTGALILNREAKFVKNVEFTSTMRTTITGICEDAVFWMGCNTTSTFPCISYDVEFSNLNFKQFSCKLPAVLVVFNINYLSLHDCSFYQNNRSAINLLDTSVVLHKVEFSDNSGNANFMDIGAKVPAGFPSSNISNGGAVAFVFRGGHQKFVNISSCSFTRNKAVAVSLLSVQAHHLKDTAWERCGGGVLVLFMNKSRDINVTFISSSFIANTALSGGAITIVSQFNASSNTITFKKCHILNNTAKILGGGISFSSLDSSEKNTLVVNDSLIKYNEAEYGGAILYVQNAFKNRTELGLITFGLEIIRTTLCGNIAKTGSAVHLYKYALTDGHKLYPVRIVDSVFCDHDFPYKKECNKAAFSYRCAIATKHVNIFFLGSNEIKDNRAACGLLASSANIHVNGTLKIARNFATYSGGGMMLTDASQLLLYPGSHIRFEGNRAEYSGGALAVSFMRALEVPAAYNTFCFLQYSIPLQSHSKWNTKVEFFGNSAGLWGGAIYVSTLAACSWMDDPPSFNYTKAFRWNDKFVYQNNCVGTEYRCRMGENFSSSNGTDIATDTQKLILHSPKQVKIAPGEKISFQLSGKDELGRETRTVAFASSHAKLKKSGRKVESQLHLPSEYFLLDPQRETDSLHLKYVVNGSNYRGITNDSVQYEITFIDSYSTFATEAKMNITPIYCRPGYVYDGRRACKCDVHQTFIKSCSGTKIKLHDAFWATPSNGKLTAVTCPPNYCKCTKYSNRGECIYDSLHSDSQCSENRMSVLCGACKGRNDNITYGLSLDDGECIECDSKSIGEAITGLVVLTIAVLCVALLIVYLNPTISTRMRDPMFYVQMLPYYYVTGKSPWGTIIRSTASLLALGGSSQLPISGCLGKDWDRLKIIALKYIFPAIILTVLVTIYILSCRLLIRFKRDSPFESLWLLLIAMYCLFCETSLIFFYCVDVNGKWVFFYDGTVECFHGNHLVMFIISSIVLVFFVIVPPVAVFLISTGRSNAPLAVMDALGKGLRLRFRWWWAVDLTRRLAFAASFVFARQNFPIFSALCITFLTVHTACQPYKDTFANMSETYLLFSMTIIAPLHCALAKDAYDDVVTAIIAANLIYIIILFLYLVVHFIKRRFNRTFGCFSRRVEERRIPIPYRIIEEERGSSSSD